MITCGGCGKAIPRFGPWAVVIGGEMVKVCGTECAAAVIAEAKRQEGDAWLASFSKSQTASSESA